MKGQKTNKSGRRFLLPLGLVMFALLLFGCTDILPVLMRYVNGTQPTTSGTECKTKECFIAAANDCNETSLMFDEDFGTVDYSAKNCNFTKTIVRLDANESQDMKNILEGKNLTCKYEVGKFDENWTSSLILDIENCNGELRDKLASLSAFASD